MTRGSLAAFQTNQAYGFIRFPSASWYTMFCSIFFIINGKEGNLFNVMPRAIEHFCPKVKRRQKVANVRWSISGSGRGSFGRDSFLLGLSQLSVSYWEKRSGLGILVFSDYGP